MIGIDSMKSQTVRGRSEEGSRSPMEQAAAVALEYLRTTGPIRRNQAMAVFEELAKWTAERAPLGLGCEFTAQNLKEGVAPDVLKEPSGWLSPVWTKAVELEPQWQEGLVQVARVLGYGYTPRLTKVGGSPSYYSLSPVPLTAAVAEEPLPDVDPGGVRYTPETVAAPAALAERDAQVRSGEVDGRPAVERLRSGHGVPCARPLPVMGGLQSGCPYHATHKPQGLVDAARPGRGVCPRG